MTMEEKEALLDRIICTMLAKPLPPLPSAKLIYVDFTKPKSRKRKPGPCQVIEFRPRLLKLYEA